jgi:hypothetical protein
MLKASSENTDLKELRARGAEMAPCQFDDKSKKPGEAELAEALGRAAGLWNELKRQAAALFDPLVEEWVFGGKKHGWALRLVHKKRAVLYMKACEGYFRASFALGEKAVRAAHESDLPASVLKIIDEAPKYAEGRGVRLEIRTAEDVRSSLKIAEIKMAN